MATRHSLLTGTQLHQPFPYEQTSDPGAVGSGKFWYDTTNNILKRRNGANTGWTSHGGAGYGTVLDEGANEAALLAAYAALPSTGGTIWLPDSLIVLTATLRITTKPVKMFGTTANSGLKINGDVSLFGSTMMIMIDNVTGVELGHFRIVHDRVAGGSTMRTLAISIHGQSRGIHLHHLAGEGITSDWIIIRPDWASYVADNTHIVDGVRVHDCHVEEWYESWINLREGVMKNVSCFNNTGTVSSGHPNGTISRPYGISVSIEDTNGLVEDCSFSHNSLTNTMESKTNSLGVIVSWENKPAPGVIKYSRVSIHANILTGWWKGAQLWWVRMDTFSPEKFPGFGSVHITSNQFIDTTAFNIPMSDVAGVAGDYLLIADNEMDVSLGATGLTGLPPPGTSGAEFMCTISAINNRNT